MKIISICICFFISINFSNAQFDRLLKKVSDTVNDNVAEKVDGLFDKKEDPAKEIPPIYIFEYEYVMNVTNKNGTTTSTYMLNLQEDILAMKEVNPDETNIFVLDHGRKKSIAYVEGNGNKALTTMPYINTNKIAQKLSKKKEKEINIRATGITKTIAGYECDEYKIEDKDYITYLYINSEVDLKGASMFSFQNNPNNDILKGSENLKPGLMMGMKSHKKNKPVKSAITMECVSFKQGSFKINNTEYYNVSRD